MKNGNDECEDTKNEKNENENERQWQFVQLMKNDKNWRSVLNGAKNDSMKQKEINERKKEKEKRNQLKQKVRTKSNKKMQFVNFKKCKNWRSVLETLFSANAQKRYFTHSGKHEKHNGWRTGEMITWLLKFEYCGQTDRQNEKTCEVRKVEIITFLIIISSTTTVDNDSFCVTGFVWWAVLGSQFVSWVLQQWWAGIGFVPTDRIVGLLQWFQHSTSQKFWRIVKMEFDAIQDWKMAKKILIPQILSVLCASQAHVGIGIRVSCWPSKTRFGVPNLES